MGLLRFFKQAKYIKELEKIIKEHEEKAERRDCNISLLKKDLNQKSEIIIKLSKKLSELNKTPPEPKYASNIDISDPIFQKMIKAGRNAIVKKAHPDHGGSREEFEKVEKAFEMLKGLKIQPQDKPFNYFGGLNTHTSAAEQQARYYREMAAQQSAGVRGFGRYNY